MKLLGLLKILVLLC